MPHLLASMVALSLFGRAQSQWPHLPQTVATHFSFQGHATGHMRKESFLVLAIAVFVLTLAACFSLRWLGHRLNLRYLNIPNRQYWFATEPRKREAFEQLFTVTDWLGFASAAVLAAVFDLTVQANLNGTAVNSRALWLVLGAFSVFVALLTVRLVRACRIPADDK